MTGAGDAGATGAGLANQTGMGSTCAGWGAVYETGVMIAAFAVVALVLVAGPLALVDEVCAAVVVAPGGVFVVVAVVAFEGVAPVAPVASVEDSAGVLVVVVPVELVVGVDTEAVDDVGVVPLASGVVEALPAEASVVLAVLPEVVALGEPLADGAEEVAPDAVDAPPFVPVAPDWVGVPLLVEPVVETVLLCDAVAVCAVWLDWLDCVVWED